MGANVWRWSGRRTSKYPSRRAPRQVTFPVLAAGVGLRAAAVAGHPGAADDPGGAAHHPADVTWVLTAYLLSASISTPILGRLGDMIGKKRMSSSRSRALAAGLPARRAGDTGGDDRRAGHPGHRRRRAARWPSASSATSSRARGCRRGRRIASMAAVGGGLGIVLAGPIVDALDYHWLFWLPLIVLVRRRASRPSSSSRSRRAHRRADQLVAALLLSGWLVALLLAGQPGRRRGAGGPAAVARACCARRVCSRWRGWSSSPAAATR